MRRDQYYRGWCPTCKAYLRWVEPTSRAVEKLQCSGCGSLVACCKSTRVDMKGELVAIARTFREVTKRGR